MRPHPRVLVQQVYIFESGSTVVKALVAGLIIVWLACSMALAEQGRGWRRRNRAPLEDQQDAITVDGTNRTYLLHVPKGLSPKKPVPLVLVFHGGGGHARGMPNFTGFDQLADSKRFIVAYPEGFNRRWNDTRGLSPADDVAFILALISKLQQSLPVDPKAVYATGISNGGFFSNRLACDLTDKIAAVASVAATMPETLLPVCKPTRPISVMYIHGKDDPIVPIEGGPIGPRPSHGRAVSLERAAQLWRDWNRTAPNAAVTELRDKAHDGTTAQRQVYGGGAQRTEVVVYTVNGGGHTWPGASPRLPALIVGKASRNLDATKVIWEFFQKHPMP